MIVIFVMPDDMKKHLRRFSFISDDSHTQVLLYKYRVDDRW